VPGRADSAPLPGAAGRGTLAAPWSPLPLVIAFTIGALGLLQWPSIPSARWLLLALPALLVPKPWRWLTLAVIAGAALTAIRAQSVIDARWPVERFGETRWVEGTIAALPQASAGAVIEPSAATDNPGDAPDTRTWRFRFDPAANARADGLPPHVRVAWYRSDETLRAGECWRLRLNLRTPHGSANPGAFDYEGWLFRQAIGATATVRGAERCAAHHGYWLLRGRQAFADQLSTWLPGHPALPMVAALTLGDTSGLDDEDWKAFRLTGTTHLVAISGFNVAIVAGVIFFLLRGLWRRSTRLCLWLPAPRAALIGSVLVALLYALLAGFDPPVQRAALMLLLLAMAGWWGGLGQPARALALAWLIIVAGDPLVLLSPGLWLSFSAVAAIFYVVGGRLGAVAGWRAAIQVQLSLSLMLAPLALFWFQGTSLTGPLVNLLAVPAAAVLTPALIGALLLAWVVPVIGLPVLGGVADVLAYSQDGLIAVAQATPQAWAAASPEAAALLLALIGALALFAPTGLPLRVFGVIAFAAVLLPPPRAVDSGFRVTVLDVGQGLAVVVQTRNHALLFDAGPAYAGSFDAGRSVVVPVLLRNGVRRLDRLIVSHGDLDHRGGVDAVLAAILATQRSGFGSDQPCVAGDHWQWDGVAFTVLAGPEPGLSDNDGSCVLRIAFGPQAALLTGDIEAEAEARLLAREAPNALRADLLVAPHHGSRTSSSAAFINAVQPRLVVYSAGWHHHFGHPARVVVDRYAELDPRQVSTGDDGAVTVNFGMTKLRFDLYRQTSPRLWSTPADHAWWPRPDVAE